MSETVLQLFDFSTICLIAPESVRCLFSTEPPLSLSLLHTSLNHAKHLFTFRYCLMQWRIQSNSFQDLAKILDHSCLVLRRGKLQWSSACWPLNFIKISLILQSAPIYPIHECASYDRDTRLSSTSYTFLRLRWSRDLRLRLFISLFSTIFSRFFAVRFLS